MPRYSVICHCDSCRRASGAPSVAWLTFERAQVRMLTSVGVPSGTWVELASSPGVLRRFCGRCGTAIAYETASAPDHMDLTTLSLDDPIEFPPTHEVWVEERLPWIAPNLALEQYPRDIASGTLATAENGE